MKSQLDESRAPWWLLAVLAVGVGLASCKTEDVDQADEDEPSGSAGSSGSETGGSANGSAGESSTDTGGGPSGGGADGQTGSSGAAGDGAVGGGRGGATGDAAAAGAGGVYCPPDPEEEDEECEPEECVPRTPSDPLITDWEDVRCQNGLFLDGDSWEAMPTEWWEGFFGGPFAYPEPDPSANVLGLVPSWDTGALVISGTVDTWAGFGLWFEKCMIDMSAYSGVSFKIWGNPGPSGTLTMGVKTSATSAPEDKECFTNVGACDSETETCTPPSTIVQVPEAEETVTLAWTDFSGGSPVDGVDPGEIIQLQWEFDWGGESDTPYEVSVTVDDIMLVNVE